MSRPDFLDTVFHRYEWVAVTIGLIGNAAFLAGSLLWAFDVAGVASKVLFVSGAFGMLVRAIARLYVDRRTRYFRRHGYAGGEAMAAARREEHAADA